MDKLYKKVWNRLSKPDRMKILIGVKVWRPGSGIILLESGLKWDKLLPTTQEKLTGQDFAGEVLAHSTDADSQSTESSLRRTGTVTRANLLGRGQHSSSILPKHPSDGPSVEQAKFGGMMSEFDKLLEDVARELAEMGASNRSWQAKDNCDVLKRRLLPLLEAGQAMREVSRIRGELWDAARQAAMEGR